MAHVPVRCVYETTLACNLRCLHCGSRAGVARPDELSTAEARDLFRQIAGLGCQRVTLSGGEPTLRPDWPELIRAAREAGLQVGMITNGLGFDREAARTALQNGLAGIGFSLDGIGATHDRVRRPGHFAATMAAIAAAQEARLPVTLITTLNRDNLGELDQLYALTRAVGAYSWQVQPGIPMGNLGDNAALALDPRDLPRAERAIAALIQRGEQRVAVANTFGWFGPHEATLRASHGAAEFKGCAAGTRTLGIASNGDIKGCMAILPGGGPGAERYVEGNVRDTPLAEIWSRPGAFAYNRDFSMDDLTGFCRACDHAEACRGGCHAVLAATGGGSENHLCVHRALCEGGVEIAPAGAPALRRGMLALALGALVTATGPGCGDKGETGDTGTPETHEGDTDTDADSDSDTDADTDADSDADAYDIDMAPQTDLDDDPSADRDGGASSAF